MDVSNSNRGDTPQISSHRQSSFPQISSYRQKYSTGNMQGREVTIGGKPLQASASVSVPSSTDSTQKHIITKSPSRFSQLSGSIGRIFSGLFKSKTPQQSTSELISPQQLPLPPPDPSVVVSKLVGELVTTERKFQQDMSALVETSNGSSLLGRIKEVSAPEGKEIIANFEEAVISLSKIGPEMASLLEQIEKCNQSKDYQGVVDILCSKESGSLIDEYLSRMGQCAIIYEDFSAVANALEGDEYNAILKDLSEKTKGSRPQGDNDFSSTAIKTVQRAPRWIMLLEGVAKNLEKVSKNSVKEELENAANQISTLKEKVQQKVREINAAMRPMTP